MMVSALLELKLLRYYMVFVACQYVLDVLGDVSFDN